MAALSSLATCAAAQALQRFEYSEIIMGVEARIVLYADEEASARRAARAAFDRLAHLDAVMSDWRCDSELMQACGAAADGPVSISNDLYRILERARDISEATGGAFDVTVGPIVKIWREARREDRLPDPEALVRARSSTGWRQMTVDPRQRTLELRPGMSLDLGGIGKGFAADEALKTLEAAGIEQALVDVGGDIAAGSAPPDAAGWRIAIDSQRGRPMMLARAGVATSGDTVQYLEVGEKRYSHVVDPRTGMPLTNRVWVTVVARDAATADALASAISVLGPREGLVVLSAFPGTSALIQQETTDGVRRMASETFPIDPRLDWPRRKALLIGIDGLRPDALAVASTPNLDGLIAEGCYTDQARTGEVTVSGPGWSSFLTGVWMDKHGVRDNTFEGSNYGDYPHFFARLQEQRPDAFTVSIADWLPIDTHIVGETGADYRFARDYEDDGDAWSVDAAVDALTNHDPDAMFVYFADLDVAGHNHGFHPAAPEYIAQLGEIDGQIGVILAAMGDRPTFADEAWLVIVSTDHGGTIDGGHGRDIPLHRTIPLIISGPGVARGTLHSTANQVDIPVTALAWLGVEIDPAWDLDGRPVGLEHRTRYRVNLVVNGDADSSRGYERAQDNAGVRGWTDTGSMTLIRYGAPEGYPGPQSAGPPGRGRNFFCGGADPESEIRQVIDVSDVAGDIDAGVVEYELAGWLGGFSDQRDLASLTTRFLDGRGGEVGRAVIGPVTLESRRDADGIPATGLFARSTSGTLPAGTRRIELRLFAEAATGSNDGYADELSLVLRRAME